MRKLAAMICVLSFSGGCSGPPPAHSAESHGATPASSGVTRTYYIAADEVVWDYAPSGRNGPRKGLSGIEAPYMSPGRTCRPQGEESALSRVHRLVFHHAEAARARMGPPRLPRPADPGRSRRHDQRGVPQQRAIQGERASARRVLQQGLRGRPLQRRHRGADKADDGVPTGRHAYLRVAGAGTRGPGEHDGSSVLWMYHSHVDEIRDVASGLIGPMIVTRQGRRAPTDRRRRGPRVGRRLHRGRREPELVRRGQHEDRTRPIPRA